MKTARGCEVPAPFHFYQIGKELFNRCPLKIIEPESMLIMKAYLHYQDGFLPHAGGAMDQSNYLMEAIEILISVVNQINLEDAK